MTDKPYGYSFEVNELLWEKDKEILRLKKIIERTKKLIRTPGSDYGHLMDSLEGKQ